MRPCFHWLAPVWLAAALFPAGATSAAVPRRDVKSLNGDWWFQRDSANSNEWKRISVPSSFEQHEGKDFDGVGWYRREVAPIRVPPGRRVWIEFDAAATETEVWWDGERLGSHLGGWTPFRFDVTDHLRPAASGAHELRVRVDERVGHNTQGFLPIIAPHFGGLWQSVRLVMAPETCVDDLRLLAVGDVAKSQFRIELPLRGPGAAATPRVRLRCRLRGESSWLPLAAQTTNVNGALLIAAPVASPKLWSPAEPNLYELEISLGKDGDRVRVTAAFRSFEAAGDQLRLNGRPVQIRGVLNWGYSPPFTAPNPGEAVWRRELEFARARGFNLMKFCLWIPPRRYLELADELGMLTWMEYPTWHPTLTARHLDPLRREFLEFFQIDRNHPSVVLRSLTCETGPGAELPVIQNLYDLAKATIPGAVVEDDSSWIGWNRVNDLWDDHPYGNNHTWRETLNGFKEHMAKHGVKPLVLGEAIAADTWLDCAETLRRLGRERPWWAPGPLDAVAQWQNRLRPLVGAGALDRLGSDSLRYGMLMRKFQTEVLRREIPSGGYVISVIRDIPNASMGLIDYFDRPKWTESDWSWQRDTACLLRTESDRRGFAAGEQLRADVYVSHFGREPIPNASLELTLCDPAQPGAVLQRNEVKALRQEVGTVAKVLTLDWTLPVVEKPRRLVINARLRAPQSEFQSDWPIWVVPAASASPKAEVKLHASLAAPLAGELFPGAQRWSGADGDGVIVASRFDDDLVRALEQGGRVLVLPDGEKHSFPLADHWFLRGAPVVPDAASALGIPADLLVELQHLDLAGPVVPNLEYLEEIDPLLLLWDTHDLKTVKTHGLIFETRARRGRLLVSALKHDGKLNLVGAWLLDRLLAHLNSTNRPARGMSTGSWETLKRSLHVESTNLVACTWRFHPDPKNEGLTRGWHQPALASEEDWSDIRIGEAWESQGFPALDGWAWYRLVIAVPPRWRGQPVFLNFEGVDDLYQLYVNGELAGKDGDLATRQDAFNKKKSHDLTRWAGADGRLVIAVRVHDWYGAGGIFRPVILGTTPFSETTEWLK